ncbi:ATP-dependent DNA helicase [Trichonephila clavipes]|nr:ATP-dependent DNA helicase [Trichonephila clavipes]
MPFKSIYTIADENETVNFATEVLNSLDIPGMTPHNLQLKIDSKAILQRNLNPLRVNPFGYQIIAGNVVEATILTGKFKREIFLLPRIRMISPESQIPFKCFNFQSQIASFCCVDFKIIHVSRMVNYMLHADVWRNC